MNYFKITYDNGAVAFVQSESPKHFDVVSFFYALEKKGKIHHLFPVNGEKRNAVIRFTNKIFEIKMVNEKGMGRSNPVWEIIL